MSRAHRTPPRGKLARATVAGVTAAKIGTRKMALLSKRPFLSSAAWAQHQAAAAFAAASLGQVHRATSHDGERLAVKVQYPGIGEALRNDLYMIKRFLLPLLAPPHLAEVLAEVERRLCEEVDYDAERVQTQWFHEHGRLPGVVIPRTYPDYSSSAVLTTELLDGAHLDPWLQTSPPQMQRDRAAQLLHDFFIHSVFTLHRIQADPNPGNYLFREDGAVAVLDFGSVKALAPTFCEGVLAILRAHLQGDRASIISRYCALGLAGGDGERVRPAGERALLRLGEWMSRPYRHGVFDFGEHPDFMAQGEACFRAVLALPEIRGFAPDAILFDRTLYGIFGIFTRLQARIRTRDQWLS